MLVWGTEGGTGNCPKPFFCARFSKAFLLDYQKAPLRQKGQWLSLAQLHLVLCFEERAPHCRVAREETQKKAQNRAKVWLWPLSTMFLIKANSGVPEPLICSSQLSGLQACSNRASLVTAHLRSGPPAPPGARASSVQGDKSRGREGRKRVWKENSLVWTG